MTDQLSRREFLDKAACSAAALTGLAAVPGRPRAAAQAPFGDIPALDGALVVDDAALAAASTDGGGMVSRRPRAVLRPGSVSDVARIVKYANVRGLSVVMRGRGHSRYGQALAEGGIVIDSRSLNSTGRVNGEMVEVEAGCALSTLVRVALDAGYRVPVMTDCTMLSVGGFVSVGGQSHGSHRFGAFVDQVIELDVVTGEGRLLTCSESRERELFEMTLAGLGQCAIVVRVRLRTLPAPDLVTTRTIVYDVIEPFLAEQQQLLAVDGLDFMRGSIARRDGGGWEYRLVLGMFGSRERVGDPKAFLPSGSPGRVLEAVRDEYRSFFPGVADRSRASAAPPPPRPAGAPPRFIAAPSLAVWLPASATRELVAAHLASPEHAGGIVAIECTALTTARFRRPLFRVPAEERMFAFWTLRSVLEGAGPDLGTQLAANAAFLRRALPVGARRYPPYGGQLDAGEWRAHYGAALYDRFAAAKRTYDPRRILTPGPNVFA
jgi:FAD/FMN-containing dehydrogenase